MRKAISETDRRREIQIAYTPSTDHAETVYKGISEISEFLAMESRSTPAPPASPADGEPMTPDQLEKVVVELEEEMLAAAEDLRFEEAAGFETSSRSYAATSRGAALTH